MWPKLLMQLFELLPHISRLVPMADKYFSQKTAAEKANEAALAAMAEGVRGRPGAGDQGSCGALSAAAGFERADALVDEEVKKARVAAANSRTSGGGSGREGCGDWGLGEGGGVGGGGDAWGGDLVVGSGAVRLTVVGGAAVSR